MELIELKNDRFRYIDRKYVQKRYVNVQCTIFITQDDLDYVKVYKLNEGSSHPSLWYELYHENNPHSYPIYTVEEAVKRIEKVGVPTNKISIHPSHFKKGMEDLCEQ